MDNKIAFYEFNRQHYAEQLGHKNELMIGDYSADDERELGDGGEFQIELMPLKGGVLTPQIQCFGDAAEALMAAIEQGLLHLMQIDYESTEAFSRTLIKAGFIDISDKALDDA